VDRVEELGEVHNPHKQTDHGNHFGQKLTELVQLHL